MIQLVSENAGINAPRITRAQIVIFEKLYFIGGVKNFRFVIERNKFDTSRIHVDDFENYFYELIWILKTGSNWFRK
jgi:hypothetical protein